MNTVAAATLTGFLLASTADAQNIVVSDLATIGRAGPVVMTVIPSTWHNRGDISVIEGLLFRRDANTPKAMFLRVDCRHATFAIDAFGNTELNKNHLEVTNVLLPDDPSSTNLTPLSDSPYGEALGLLACGV